MRLLIIGCSGSGKSTLARALAARTGLPVIHLDQEYFGPDWTEPSQEVWRARVAKLVERDAWVMDGNFSGTFDLRMPRTDTIVFLNRSTWRCLWRVLKRTVKYYGTVRPGSAPGCKERFDGEFLHYVLMYNATRRPGIFRTLQEQEQAGKEVFVLRSDDEVQNFLASV
ncbi:MAG: AAA family ATPase [Bacteroidota bacterium]